jgi:hypothetical protein
MRGPGRKGALTTSRARSLVPSASILSDRRAMRLVKQGILTVLLTGLLLSLAAGLAGARTRVEVNQTAILIMGRVDIVPDEMFPIILCDITLHVTLLRLINKVRLEHIGEVTSILTANLGAIGGHGMGTPRRCLFLPGMRVQYNSISGTLPNITGILLWINTLVLIEISLPITGVSACLYAGLVGAAGNNPVRSLSILNEPLMPLFRRLEGFCPRLVFMSGVLSVVPEVTFRLLER